MQYFIKQNYYFDIDHHNQLRITGPENHLFLGLTFPADVAISVVNYQVYKGQLVVVLTLPIPTVQLHTPLVCDIRTLRSFTEQVSKRPLYSDLVYEGVGDVLPRIFERRRYKASTLLKFLNQYQDEAGNVLRYGCELTIADTHTVTYDNNTLIIAGTDPVRLVIRTITNIRVKDKFRKKLFQTQQLPLERVSPFLRDLYTEAEIQIKHLITTKKTSSFEYGTIFPRDWIESADLGQGDFTSDTVDYMYAQSMSFISEEGQGWHENIVGEFRTKISDASEHIDRKMIDIEPRYILGIPKLSKKFLFDETNKQKLLLVATYLLHNAKEHEFITFKKTPHSEQQYHYVGNWRDSYLAFPRQKAPLAPYDVNCVFYPTSLRVIREYHSFFGLDNVEELNQLIEKWDNQKPKFRLYHPNNLTGYSLALHGRKNIPLPISHLDEAYDLFYGIPSMEDIVSFAKKIVDPDFFYTPVGPLLVASDEEEFTTQHYHGKVIWPKQTAYAVAGLSRQYRRSMREGWPWPVVTLIKDAIIKTCEASFQGFSDLGVVPELYYYHAESGKAKLYTDQEHYEGQMSLIQLWSSVGLRRLIRDYLATIHS